jgi:hypothetical protein
VNDDTPDIPNTEDIEVREEAARVARHAVGAVTLIRDPDDEQFVFRFEIGPAILIQLLEKLRQLAIRPIKECLDARHPGFYQIFLDGRPVYIGKTSRHISKRLKEHIKKLRGRFSLERVGCRFAYVEDPSLVDMAESALITFFKALGEADWNRSGVGSKTTGYGRAATRAAQWDTNFPINLNLPIEAGSPKLITLDALIRMVGKQSPIPFSIPRTYTAAFKAAHIGKHNFPVATRSFQEWVELIEKHLSTGWQVERQPRSWYIVSS